MSVKKRRQIDGIFLIASLLFVVIASLITHYNPLHDIFKGSPNFTYSGLASNPAIQFVVLYAFAFSCVGTFIVERLIESRKNKSAQTVEPDQRLKHSKNLINASVIFFVFATYILIRHWDYISIHFAPLYYSILKQGYYTPHYARTMPIELVLLLIETPIFIPFFFWLKEIFRKPTMIQTLR